MRKVPLKKRLEHSENAWLKFHGEFGDLCRLMREVKAEEHSIKEEFEKRLRKVESEMDKILQNLEAIKRMKE